MEFLFVKSGKVGSQLIRWGLGEDCSHFAVRFDLMPKPVLIEARGDTGRVQGTTDLAPFYRDQTIVHRLMLAHADMNFEKALYRTMYPRVGECYDYKAMAFWTVAVAARRLFGLPAPTENKWGSRTDHYCVEVLQGSEPVLKQYLGVDLMKIDLEMTSPFGLYRLLKSCSLLMEKPA
jgi:hypothetical protein